MNYSFDIPDIEFLYPLYVASGWNESLQLAPTDIDRAVHNSSFVLSVFHQQQLIGFGRVVSDGVAYATIYDVIVTPGWRSQGIGSEIVRRLVEQCEGLDIRSIHLFAARGSENFYRSLGFIARPSDSPGMVYEKV